MARIRTGQRQDQITSIGVWTVWIGMTISLLAFFVRDHTNVPLGEDWYIVPALTGHETDFTGWLWSQNNEHRVPLPRLVFLTLLKITGGKFYAVGAFNALVLATVAAGLILLMRARRGSRTAWADAIFPLLLLNWGHSSQVLFPFLVSLVLPVVVTIGIGCALAAPETLARRRVAGCAALCLLALPLCGFVGLLYVPGMALALGYLGWRFWTGRGGWPSRRISGLILLVAVLLTVSVGGLYFVGYDVPSWNPDSPGLLASFIAGLRVVSYALGAAAIDAPRLFVVLTFSILLLAAAHLWRGFRAVRGRERELALLAGWFLVNTVGFGFAVGWGRAGWIPEYGIPPRYALLVAPILIAVVFVWQSFQPVSLGRWLPGALALVLLALVPWNTSAGNERFANWYRDGMRVLHADIEAGVPIDELARRHQPFLIPTWTPEKLATHMRWLRQAGITPFARARDIAPGERAAAASVGGAPH